MFHITCCTSFKTTSVLNEHWGSQRNKGAKPNATFSSTFPAHSFGSVVSLQAARHTSARTTH